MRLTAILKRVPVTAVGKVDAEQEVDVVAGIKVQNVPAAKGRERPMLFRKKENETNKPIENIEPHVCKTCGCLVSRFRAHEVIMNNTDNFEPITDYYCGLCAPAYDKYESGWIKKSDDILGAYEKYFIRVPEHYEEVTKEGKPLKKKK